MNYLQKLTVKDAYRLDYDDPIILGCDDEFIQVIENFAQHADLRGVFVVDEEFHFSGVITRTDLLDWARVKLGAALLMPLTDSDKAIRMSTLVNATTVGDILRQETNNVAVFGNDSLAHALRIMVESDLVILPVINKSRHIIGNLSLSELLNRVLIKSQE